MLLPASVQVVRAFQPHDETAHCNEQEQHFCSDQLDCDLCHLQADISGIIPEQEYSILKEQVLFTISNSYDFSPRNQHLSFSLRGPPSF